MKLNIFRGALFRFCNEKGVFTDKHGCVIDVTDRVTYYRWEKGSFVVEDCSIEQFDKYRISFGIPYDLELKAKVTGFKQSASLYGMRQRKEAFMYAVMDVAYIEETKANYAFVLTSIIDDGLSIKMDPSEIELIYPINSYKYKR